MKRTIVAMGLLMMGIVSSAQSADTCLTTTRLGISYPPVKNAVERAFTEAHLDSLNTSMIRFSESWRFREPTPGNFNWAPLDERMLWAESNAISVLLTIEANGPDWACDPTQQNEDSCAFSDTTAFRSYVESLLQRYPGKIDKLQFGNEMLSSSFYAGTAESFLASSNIVYESVRTYAPEVRFVLGGFSTGTVRRYSGCNNDTFFPFYGSESWGMIETVAERDAFCAEPWVQDENADLLFLLSNGSYDEIDIHLYDDVENWHYFHEDIQSIVPARTMIVSEFGGPNLGWVTYSDSLQAAELHKYITKIDSLQIEEAYFFKLVERGDNTAHGKSGLIESITLVEKPAYFVFQDFEPCDPAAVNRGGLPYPVTFRLNEAYPNPFGPSTVIGFRLLTDQFVTLGVYNATGQAVRTLLNGTQPVGEYSAVWDGRDDLGNALASGVYHFRLSTGQFAMARRVVLLR